MSSCPPTQVCEQVGGQPTCAIPLVVQGQVLDVAGRGIAGALVSALDANDAPATGTTTSGLDGKYELPVSVARTADGAPLVRQIRLRASAAGFETFPSGLRRSLPIEPSTASLHLGRLIFESTATDLVLLAVPDAERLGSITGTVAGPAGKRGVLIVAEAPGRTVTSISDADGAYVIFNVPPGTYSVRGYAAGVQLTSATAQVAAGARASGVHLAPRDVGLGAVSGNVNIVNAPGGSLTSVVLVVASTFNAVLARGEVPPGLRSPRAGAPDVSGPFTMTDVPDGDYVVLAAFENDNLVRDPDTAIGGTDIQRITIGDATRQITLAASFKVTAALAIMRPGAGEHPEPMTATPTFVWQDDSSEDRYLLEVRDSRGDLVWSNPEVPKHSGGQVSWPYAGPALKAGGFYQFRVTSFRRGDVPISQTEDLRGVFLVQ